MFTGIIEALGTMESLRAQGGEQRLRIRSEGLDLSDVEQGDSIAVSGVCLTVTAFGTDWFDADVSAETLRLTTLGQLRGGARVNLEKALTPTTRLGGHLVSGHVDGVGRLLSREPEGGSIRLEFEVPGELARYVARKGSICIDGTSLTVNDVKGARFSVNIIPHTQDATIIHGYRPGCDVNLEVDVIARYLERLLTGGMAGDPEEKGDGLTAAFLYERGFGAPGSH
ncbi:MAG: riboflavin synthase [Pseudomonadota bacterium]